MDEFPSREREADAALAPRVSAIVVVRGVSTIAAKHALELSIRSALAEPWIDDLVIVDAGNAPDVASSLRGVSMDRRDLRLIVAPAGASVGAAANLGAAQARGRWLLFLSPDVVLQRGAAARLASAGAVATAPWIVGGRLTDASGRDRSVARIGALNTWSSIAVAVGWGGAPPRARPGRDEAPAAVGAVSCAFMLVPRDDFQALGGFDELFDTDGADLDLCRRAAAAGGSVLFQGDASGVQFARAYRRDRKLAQGLARFALTSARTPFEKIFAVIAGPTIATLLALRDFVGGRPPLR